MRARLAIDLDAVAANWRALDRLSGAGTETGAVVKADAYGLGADRVGPALARAGARSFFVAQAEEGAALRAALGPGPRIFVFAGLMPGDEGLVRAGGLTPLLNSPEQVRAAAALARAAGAPLTVGLQVDSGMNRLGMEAAELAGLDPAADLEGLEVVLFMSHLACADDPDHPQNEAQRAAFDAMRARFAPPGAAASLAATGGVLLGAPFHYDMTRPGVGLYGGLPYAEARPVIRLELPIIQVREVAAGEAVGYGAAWRAGATRRIATLSAGYADGLLRSLGDCFAVRVGPDRAPAVGRVSMDLITVDVTDAPAAREGAMAEIIGAGQTIDDLAQGAGTIGYEILTSLGARYHRVYLGG